MGGGAKIEAWFRRHPDFGGNIAAGAPSNEINVADELTKLAALRDSGAITDKEFTGKKAGCGAKAASSGFSPAERGIYAVLDSADSDVPVCASADRNAARRLKTAHTFHCSTALGGCGTELTFATGDINIPHFRHRTGVRCALMGSGSITDRYTHLAYATGSTPCRDSPVSWKSRWRMDAPL